jgi:hypothetical protein
MTIPNRAIFSESDISSFKNSVIYDEIQKFVEVCSHVVQGCKISDATPASPVLYLFPNIYSQYCL